MCTFILFPHRICDWFLLTLSICLWVCLCFIFVYECVYKKRFTPRFVLEKQASHCKLGFWWDGNGMCMFILFPDKIWDWFLSTLSICLWVCLCFKTSSLLNLQRKSKKLSQIRLLVRWKRYVYINPISSGYMTVVSANVFYLWVCIKTGSHLNLHWNRKKNYNKLGC